MNIRFLAMTNFMIHRDTELEFPASGIVTIRGNNGQGKSTPIDAIHFALTGKTLRGTNPISTDAKSCKVEVCTDTHDICRTYAGKHDLVWARDGDSPSEYETPTKATAALNAEIDPELWLRTSVFNSSLLSFGGSTDSQRKLLLEQLLGLGRFDTAYRAALAELNAARAAHTKSENDMRLAQMRVDAQEQRITDEVERSGVEVPDISGLESTQRKAETELLLVQQQERELEEELDATVTAAADLYSKIAEHKNTLKIAELDVCPTCRQEVEPDFVAGLVSDIPDLLTTAERDWKACREEEAEIRSELSAVRVNISSLRTEINMARRDIQSAKVAALAEQRSGAFIESLMEEHARAEEAVAKLRLAVYANNIEVETCEASVSVLGTRGYRSYVLGSALSGLEQATNQVLSHLCEPENLIQIQLRSFTEGAKGKVTEAISLSVDGAGGGYGYKALSSGQQRRIDIATLLGAAAMSETGTLWFDEVFDSLDKSGTDRLVDVLSDMATNRCIVVITHSDELHARIPAVMKLLAQDGSFVVENG